jgi:prevent-host-death family protein
VLHIADRFEGAEVMAATMSLREAHQRFAEVMRAVENGAEFVITRRGRPVARIVPAGSRARPLSPEQRAALARLMAGAAASNDVPLSR